MNLSSEPRAFFSKLHKMGSIMVVMIGISTLIGWLLNIAVLKSVVPGLAQMKVNTAVGFVCIGTAVLCFRASNLKIVSLGRALACLTLIIGTLTLFEYIFKFQLGIDEFLVSHPQNVTLTQQAWRMTPAAALNFTLVSLTLLGSRSGFKGVEMLTRWCVLPVNLTSMLALFGYLSGSVSLYKLSFFSSMAVHTAMAFWVASICAFIGDSSQGYMKILSSDTSGGAVARRLIPIIPLIVLSLSLARLAGEQAGWYDRNFGAAVTITSTISILTLTVMQISIVLYKADLARKSAELEIISLNSLLERRVEERTAELSKSLAEVKQLSGLLPLCSYCRKIRGDKDYWHTVEEYVLTHTDARFSHGICPACIPIARAEMGLKPISTNIARAGP